jgi:hypothetical protein
MKEFTKIVLIITLLLLSKVIGVSQICSRGNYLDLMNSICLLSQTTVGEKSDINQYACSSVPHYAPEKIYSFYVQEACNVQIGLEILNGVDLDLFLFKYSCLAAIRENSSEIINCIASSGSGNTSSNKEAIQIFLQPGEYFLAVDANSASTIGNFNLDITCGDLNCTTAMAISCNIPINGTTVGSANNSSIYSFSNSASRDVNNSGPEKIYSFTLNSVSNIDILLNNFSSNLDLFLISDCKTKVFLSKSDNSGNGVAERINVANLSAGKYFIVVDGYRCSSGSFTLQVNSSTCSNEDCSNIEKTFNTGTNSYRLRLNRSGASNFVWSVLQTGQTSNQSLIDIPVRSTNVNVTVNLSYILNGITYNCTKNICVKSPLTCQEISYKIIDNNCVKYELSSSNASDITWVDNSTGIIFGRNRLSDCLSIPSCANKNITVNYVLDGTEYTCINQAYICPPAEKCENIDYVYDNNNGCYRFNLNFPGIVPTNISWINDNTGGTLGSAIQSNCLYVPISSNCSDYQITVNFSANGNFAYLKNEVTYVASDTRFINGDAAFQSMGPVTRTEVGQSYNTFYGFQSAGIFQNAAEVANNKNGAGGLIQPTAKPGDFRWVDTDGDGSITDKDKTFLGSSLPKYTFGLTLNADYKGFDVMVFAQGAAGNKIFQGLRRLDIGTANWQTRALSRWTGDGTSTTYPRLTSADDNGNFGKMSDFYLEDGNYLRLKVVQIGYTLPVKMLKKIGGTKLRVYATGENLLTLTKYTGYDPEIGGGVFGIDKGVYPQAKSFILGIQLQF